MKGGKEDGLRTKPTYTITINTFSKIVKGGEVDILIPNSTSCTTSPTIPP